MRARNFCTIMFTHLLDKKNSGLAKSKSIKLVVSKRLQLCVPNLDYSYIYHKSHPPQTL